MEVAVAAPAGELLLANDVAGVGERRHPVAVAQLSVPAAMIVVQVGAHDEVDVGGLEPCRGQTLQVGPVELVEVVHRVRLAVPRARVDEHDPAVGDEDPALEDEVETVRRRRGSAAPASDDAPPAAPRPA